ncbi:RidA family protein [Sporosarcina psychrophila]|uniref:RidA family protein n=1 Tax=Sporosarcina psychrophila TaxID=1476 RepID=UPI00078C8F71|nr:RidA family protein [Sporosarcina psychrophila]AMQ07701.1 hypothetical protein AZE41_18125 [Sporosarcina psychrophila]
MNLVDQRLKELGITLPEPYAPVASYTSAMTVNDMVYTSGNDCRVNGTLMYTGKLGKELTIEQGKMAARQTMINLLSTLKQHIGSLDRVEQVVKLLGFIRSEEGFKDQPYVLDGASDLLGQIFGSAGVHARSAIGTSELPFGTPVEIEMIVKIKAE